MSDLKTEKIHDATTKIWKIIDEDSSIKHCRINIINGLQEVFHKYKETLVHIENDKLTVRFYKDHTLLCADLFEKNGFMSTDWFNFYVFNIGKNGKSLGEEIKGVEHVTRALTKRFDSKYYSTLIVSALEKKDLAKAFEEEVGEECPVDNYRYLGYDFDGLIILDYLQKILHTHSAQFLSRWQSAIIRLEESERKLLASAQ